MHLLRLIATHPVVAGQMERAARENKWARFRTAMAEIGIDCKVLIEPFAILMSMQSDKYMMYPDMHIVMHVGDSGTPWCSNLTAMADYKRVGHHSISWGFSRFAHKQMRKAGFSVERHG